MPENLREAVRRLQVHLQKLRDTRAKPERIKAIEKMIADLQEDLVNDLPPPPNK